MIKTINGIEVLIISGIDIPDAEIIIPTEGKPFSSWRWVINETGETYWDSPVTMPTEDGKAFRWDEESLSWVQVN